RFFFRVSQPIHSLEQARAVFKTLGSYGDMIEYKFMRCPETRSYLRHGFVVYKRPEDGQQVLNDKFIRVDSNLFKEPCDVKIERT
ncbi:uncharacterized protein BYT42DRAFT_475940, partial [Radiomyces spectabilis]|uniref:uncharacterized protein n=1 Tax=Radiomyces spectabilis TaxID=64574 RepID=UPI002220B43C